MVAKSCWTHLANNLLSLRSAHALTQKQVGLKAGVGQHTISNMEKPGAETIGTPTLTRIEKVAGVFDMKAWHLLLPWHDISNAKVNLVDQLIEGFCNCSLDGQQNILRITEAERRYSLQNQLQASLERDLLAAEPVKDYT